MNEIKRLFQDLLAETTCKNGKYPFMLQGKTENSVAYHVALKQLLKNGVLSEVPQVQCTTYEAFDFDSDIITLYLDGERVFFSVTDEDYELFYLLLYTMINKGGEPCASRPHKKLYGGTNHEADDTR